MPDNITEQQRQEFAEDRARRRRARNRFFLHGFGALGAGVGCVVLGYALDWFWLCAIGMVILAPIVLVVTIFGSGLVCFWIIYFGPILLFSPNSPFRRIENYNPNDDEAKRRAGPPVSVEECYHLFATRAAPVGNPADLCGPVKRLVRSIQHYGREFALYAYSPAFHLKRVLSSWDNRIPKFLATSEIEWNHGREPSDPTHEFICSTRFNGTLAVYLRIAFVVEGAPATCPGLTAELRLTPAAAGPDAKRPARLDHLLALLKETLAADSVRLEPPAPLET